MPFGLVTLVKRIVMNPFSNPNQKNEIKTLVEANCRELSDIVFESEIAKPPVIASTSGTGESDSPI